MIGILLGTDDTPTYLQRPKYFFFDFFRFFINLGSKQTQIKRRKEMPKSAWVKINAINDAWSRNGNFLSRGPPMNVLKSLLSVFNLSCCHFFVFCFHESCSCEYCRKCFMYDFPDWNDCFWIYQIKIMCLPSYQLLKHVINIPYQFQNLTIKFNYFWNSNHGE
jgi:hypothetical protein